LDALNVFRFSDPRFPSFLPISRSSLSSDSEFNRGAREARSSRSNELGLAVLMPRLRSSSRVTTQASPSLTADYADSADIRKVRIWPDQNIESTPITRAIPPSAPSAIRGRRERFSILRFPDFPLFFPRDQGKPRANAGFTLLRCDPPWRSRASPSSR
jgi:hypothetical protein